MGKSKLAWTLVALGVVIAGLTLAWRFTPLAELLKPAELAQRLESVEKYGWAPVFFVAAYVVGGLVVFPVTLMSAVTAIVFPPHKAVAISFTGIMLSAALLHWIGARLLGDRLKASLGSTIERLDAALSDRGIVTIATIRMIPLAPFTLVNIAAGSIGVRFRDYMLGTALGLAPGITVVSLFGRQVRGFWRHPSTKAVLIAILVGAVWIAMSIALQKWAARRNQKVRGSSGVADAHSSA